MGNPTPEGNNRSIGYHFLMGLGFAALIGWFWLMREVEFMSWLASKGPRTHTGAMNLLAVMIWMLPALLCWKYYLRYIHRKLKITGMFYEDHFYRDETDTETRSSKATAVDKQSPEQKQQQSDDQSP